MKTIQFAEQRSCPLCSGGISSAELEPRYEPVVVFRCPHCSRLLWRPGLEEDGPLHAFDPDADAGGI
jgi:hypothetical protein